MSPAMIISWVSLIFYDHYQFHWDLWHWTVTNLLVCLLGGGPSKQPQGSMVRVISVVIIWSILTAVCLGESEKLMDIWRYTLWITFFLCIAFLPGVPVFSCCFSLFLKCTSLSEIRVFLDLKAQLHYHRWKHGKKQIFVALFMSFFTVCFLDKSWLTSHLWTLGIFLVVECVTWKNVYLFTFAMLNPLHFQ